MNGCLKCIHKPFCTLSASGAVCSSFKDKDRYADRNEVIREFAERLIKKCDAPHWCVWMSEIEDLVKEMIGEAEP